jgi:hypothetical protein
MYYRYILFIQNKSRDSLSIILRANVGDIKHKTICRIYHERVLRQWSVTLEGKLLSVKATWFTNCSGGVDWGKGQVVMYGLSLSVSTVQTNYKGRSPIREVEPQRNIHFPENIDVLICVMNVKRGCWFRKGLRLSLAVYQIFWNHKDSKL